ncbi:hypothetical protein E2C01_067104 [Portunus trituberculatus]|uniref:Uncharacterized protein n=1 Tax=Portunus trituberculatus TaxID=210409 RepID=A0A5B7HIX9_PORTR|nr:hypothetical protein [Portunus trituberculatus]
MLRTMDLLMVHQCGFVSTRAWCVQRRMERHFGLNAKSCDKP